MDNESNRALLNVLITALCGGAFAALIKQQTDRQQNKLAELRFRAEESARVDEVEAQKREEDRARIKEIREELKEARQREIEKDLLWRESEGLYQDRVIACRDCKYPCMARLRENALRKLENAEQPPSGSGGESGTPEQ